VVGAASIVNRGSGVKFEVPYVALLEMNLPTYEPERCPLCAQGMSVVKPGSRPVAT
jgi:orotate phosphoribosyltransferase